MVVIAEFADVADNSVALAKIDEIFFEASSVQSFANETAREDFRWLWMGRYLSEEPEHAFVALRNGDAGQLCGYLVGSLADPAVRAEFNSLAYFKSFADITPRFPAHLHINVAHDMRGQGVGERLIHAFLAHAQAQGCPGVHVVTGAGMRNVGFYERLNFVERARVAKGPGEVVLLGHQLD